MEEEYSRVTGACSFCGEYFPVLKLQFTKEGGKVFCIDCRESEVNTDEQKSIFWNPAWIWIFNNSFNGQTAAVEEGELVAGEAFEIQPGLPHQLEAIDSYAQVLEASTFHMDSDSYSVWR